jgi:hypothetical protein
MKKYLIFTIAMIGIAALSASCSSSDDDDVSISLSQSEITLNGKTGTAQLTATPSNVEWSSDNPFVATINNQGLVTAIHVGQTRVIAKSGNSSKMCNVIVSPQYSTFTEPLTEFGKNKAYIISKLGTPNTQSDNLIAYGAATDYQVTSYTFENDKLTMCTVALRATDSRVTQLPLFFIERYEMKSSKINGMTAYYNASSESDASMYVLFDTQYSAGHYWIYYSPKNK